MRKKENQRIALTKRLLKESLLQLMPDKSIQNITVSELCQAAQINRSTFYNHYGCPADVLAEIENGVIDDLNEIWKEEGSRKNWTLDKRVEALCTYLQENRSLSKLLLRDSDTNSGFATLLLHAAHVQATYEQTLSYIKDQDNKRLMITFLINGAYHMIRQWLLEDIPKTPKEMGQLIYLAATQGWEKTY
ncbi:TetR/AcrR family transcriptional regulator [Butyricicoccus sp.]|uniref:TetR/AcrR family transcriptional regulator n=1 Tax=Butyricicoccus sp. TaxID=2049021 RepID=UPI003F191AF6